MSPLQPRKVRRLLKHFKNIKTKNVEKIKPKLTKGRVKFQEPIPELISSIKSMKSDFKIDPPKLIINTVENKELPFLKQKLAATENLLSQDERRLYEIFSEINELKEKFEKQDLEKNEQDQKIKELEKEIQLIASKPPNDIQTRQLNEQKQINSENAEEPKTNKFKRLLHPFKNIKDPKEEEKIRLLSKPQKTESDEQITNLNYLLNPKIDLPQTSAGTIKNTEFPLLKPTSMIAEKNISQNERRLNNLFSDINELKEKYEKHDIENNESGLKFNALEETIHIKKSTAMEHELDKDKLYELFSNIGGLKEEIEKQKSEGEEQDQKIKELEKEIQLIETKKSNDAKQTLQLNQSKTEKLIMDKDKKVNTLQNTLILMQNKLNQLIKIKVKEENDKMKENKTKLNDIDKSITKFEIKLIRLQSKHSQKKLMPLMKKIQNLKDKYNEIAIKLKSKENFNVATIELDKVPKIPDIIETKNIKKSLFEKEASELLSGYRNETSRETLPISLDLPDITQGTIELDLDLPDPVPNPTSIRPITKTKKKAGFLENVGLEVKKFLHIGS